MEGYSILNSNHVAGEELKSGVLLSDGSKTEEEIAAYTAENVSRIVMQMPEGSILSIEHHSEGAVPDGRTWSLHYTTAMDKKV